MQYTCLIRDGFVFAYLGNKLVGKFDTETFLTNVISPLEFNRFENNPFKVKFEIRKLDFNNNNLK